MHLRYNETRSVEVHHLKSQWWVPSKDLPQGIEKALFVLQNMRSILKCSVSLRQTAVIYNLFASHSSPEAVYGPYIPVYNFITYKSQCLQFFRIKTGINTGAKHVSLLYKLKISQIIENHILCLLNSFDATTIVGWYC